LPPASKASPSSTDGGNKLLQQGNNITSLKRHHGARESNLNQHHYENLQLAYGTHFLTAVHWYHHSTLNVIIPITLTFQASTNQGMFVDIRLQDAHCNG